MSLPTDTFEDGLRAVLHDAVDHTTIPLGVSVPVLATRSVRAGRRRTARRVVAVAVAASVVGAGVWLGLDHHTEATPAGPTASATMVFGQATVRPGPGQPASPTPTRPVLTRAPVVRTDSRGITVLDGPGPAARTLARLATSTGPAWTPGLTDPRLRVGVIPPGATLPMPWTGRWAVQTALTPLPDGSYVYVDAFASAADADAARGIILTDPSGAVLTDGTTLPATTRMVPAPLLPSSFVPRTVVVDAEHHLFGVHDGLTAGPLGPLVATGQGGTPEPIDADGTGAVLTTRQTPAAAELVVVVPARATHVRLATPTGAISTPLTRTALPGTPYAALFAQQQSTNGPVALAGLTSVSWTDPVTHGRHTHRLH